MTTVSVAIFDRERRSNHGCEWDLDGPSFKANSSHVLVPHIQCTYQLLYMLASLILRSWTPSRAIIYLEHQGFAKHLKIPGAGVYVSIQSAAKIHT